MLYLMAVHHKSSAPIMAVPLVTMGLKPRTISKEEFGIYYIAFSHT